MGTGSKEVRWTGSERREAREEGEGGGWEGEIEGNGKEVGREGGTLKEIPRGN